MTIDQIRYFFEAAKFQHVGKASQSLHISPSAISQAISALEEELGVRLFQRVGKSIVLSDSGRLFQAEALQLFDLLSGMKERVGGREKTLQGHYRLGASHYLSWKLLTPTLSKLQDANRGLTAEVCSQATATVLSDVVSGALDLGLCFSPFAHPDLQQEVIHRGQLQIAVRGGHPLLNEKGGGKRLLRELDRFPAVIHKSRPGVELCETHPMFDAFGIRPESVFYFDSDDCAIAKVVSSDAWTLVPDLVVAGERQGLKALPLAAGWEAPYTVSVVTRKDRGQNAVLGELLNLLRKSVNG